MNQLLFTGWIWWMKIDFISRGNYLISWWTSSFTFFTLWALYKESSFWRIDQFWSCILSLFSIELFSYLFWILNSWVSFWRIFRNFLSLIFRLFFTETKYTFLWHFSLDGKVMILGDAELEEMIEWVFY